MVKIEKTCPKCEIVGEGVKKVREIFGFRLIKDVKFVQSYCRECRNKIKRAKYQKLNKKSKKKGSKKND